MADRVPLSFAPEITADVTSAALIERRVAEGEITPDEVDAILNGKYATETVYSGDGYCSPRSRFADPSLRQARDDRREPPGLSGA